MLTAFDARLRYLRELIRDYAAKAPPTLQAQADANAEIELHDLDERLMGCETNDEADALVREWVSPLKPTTATWLGMGSSA